MEEISKTRMEIAIRYLKVRTAEIEGIPTLKGIPATAFDKEHLVMLCKLFADEWRKAQAKYLQATDRIFPSYIAGANDVFGVLYKPSIWRKAWKKLKRLKPKKA